MDFTAKTFAGLEGVLSNELKALGAKNIEAGRRVVTFNGDKRLLYKANLSLRTALRILVPIKSFKVSNIEDVYIGVRSIEWDTIFPVEKTFLIEQTIYSDIVSNTRFATYKAKDAIADYFNEKYGKRPNVSVANPDIFINLHISNNNCTVSLDSSGEPLYKRGYRVAQTLAPMNEVLAAGLVLLSGWDGKSNFMDPMCGSGTIAIEAALIARNIAPGIFRKHFAFEEWNDFDADLLDELYNDDSSETEFKHKIYASDINRAAVDTARKNIAAASVSKNIELTVADFMELTPPPSPLCVITNPPYGERIKADMERLYSAMGS
ncbi:MAG: methyltransferase, partial [Paludibacteraceae bacterium]|nr:methyltransferase [Paludibacteraceae bacterium]